MLINPTDFNRWLTNANFGESIVYCIEKSGWPQQSIEGRKTLSAAHAAFSADLVGLSQQLLSGDVYEYKATRLSPEATKKINFLNSREIPRCKGQPFKWQKRRTR